MRADTYPANGGPPGSDYATDAAQLLDRIDMRRAILTFGDDSHVSGHHNPYFAAELARALNDWTIDRWLAERRASWRHRSWLPANCRTAPRPRSGGTPTIHAWSR